MLQIPIRQEKSASYRTLVKSSLVTALRAVFTEGYKDSQFRGLRIDPEFALTRVTWPAIYIRYTENEVRNAGVGHVEYFPDPNGVVRKWMHSIFEGFIEFDIITESPLDRDILADGLVEVIRFGTLDAALNTFFTGIYGDISDPFSPLAVMQQIGLNSDVLVAGGESILPSPEGAEDSPIYQATYSIDILGGFYNTLPTNQLLTLVEQVNQFPYLIGDAAPGADPENIWFYPFVYYDEDYVQGNARLSSHEGEHDDAATVVSKVRLSADFTSHNDDTARIIGVSAISAVELRSGIDSQALTSVAVITTVENAELVDNNGLVSGVAVVSAPDSQDTTDSATAFGLAAHIGTDTEQSIDARTETSVGTAITIDNAAFVDSGTV